jgi:hypothetical protein
MMPGLWALEWHEPLFAVLRGAAAVGGAVLGWFLAGPACRLLIRAAFHKRAPTIVVLPARCAGAAVLACLIFYFLPLGFGGGAGWGFGPGPGGGPGGSGGATSSAKTNPDKASVSHESGTAPKREVLNIELIGGERYKDDKKYYLLRREQPPVTLKEVETYFKDNEGRLEVYIILTRDSVGESHPAVRQLRNLADKYKMFTHVDAPH